MLIYELKTVDTMTNDEKSNVQLFYLTQSLLWIAQFQLK